MMGRQAVDQSQLFYLFNLEEHIPADHLLRRLNPIVTRVLADLREKLAPFYSDIGRPSIDPELMIRMLIVGYCYGIRFERRLCEEVKLHLGYRWFCRLELDDKVPDHSTFSVNRHGRFRDSDFFRQVFEAVVRACMDAGLVKGEGFAVDASVMEADASRYHGKAPGEIDWSAPERQTRAVAEFLTALDEEDADADRKPPKVISPVDPCSAWTAKANKRVQFGYGLNYLIDIKYAVIVDVEATPARTYDEVAATKTMIKRTEQWGSSPNGLPPTRPTALASSSIGLSAPGSHRTSLFGTGARGKKASCRARTLPSIQSAISTSALRVSFSGRPGRCTMAGPSFIARGPATAAHVRSSPRALRI
jgi:transposase